MWRKSTLWLLVVLVGGAALFGFLYSTAEPAPSPGVVLVSAPLAPVPSAMPVERPLPDLVRVVVNGPASLARFRLADGSERTLGIGQPLFPGWTLSALDSGSATFATPTGDRRIALSAPPPVEEVPRTRTVVVPDAPATSADGQAVERCTDPEC